MIRTSDPATRSRAAVPVRVAVPGPGRRPGRGGDDGFGTTKALRGIDSGSPGYARLAMHRDPATPADGIVAGVETAVAAPRIARERAQ